MSTEIQLSDLTESLDGNGVFDKLMQNTSAHLLEEFQKGRITGVNYSNVYLGSLTAVMQQSIEFLLRKDLVAKQTDLTAEQVLNTAADTALKNKQVELALIQIQISEKELELKEKELEIAAQQLIKIEEEVNLIKKQNLKTDREILLLEAKTNTEKAQTDDNYNEGIVGSQKRLYAAQTQGFTNDHNYKMTKVRADIYSVMLSQDPDALWNNPPPSWVLS